MTRHIVGLSLVGVLALAGWCSAAALKYVASSESLSLQGTPWHARSHLFTEAKKGAGLTWSGAKVALLKSQQVTLAVAPDADSADAAHPKVLRFDFSGDGTFPKGNAVPLTVTADRPKEKKYYTKFGPAVVQMTRYGKTFPVTVRGYYVTRGQLQLVQVEMLVSAEAKVKLGKKTYPVRVIDANGNCRLDDYAVPMRRGGKVVSVVPGDAIAVDTGDGSFTKDVFRAHLGLPVYVDGAWYEVDLGSDKASLDVKPIAGKTGFVRVPEGDCGGMLVGTRHIVPLWASKDPIPVPPDEYHVVDFWQTRQAPHAPKDLRPGEILVRGQKELYEGTSKEFVVAPGKTVKLTAGVPLVASFDVKLAAGRVTFGLDLRDAAGSKVDSLVLPGGRRPAPPVLEIVDTTGKRIYQASLTYG